MRVLIDADLVLELFINRSGFVEDAEKLLKETAQSELVEVYITDKCLRRVRSELGDTNSELGEQSAAYIAAMFNGRIILIDSALKEQARKSPLRDFDSAEEVVCAIAMDLDAIVTQNPQNFDGAVFQIWSVSELLQRQNRNQNLRKSLNQIVIRESLNQKKKFKSKCYISQHEFAHPKFVLGNASTGEIRNWVYASCSKAYSQGSGTHLQQKLPYPNIRRNQVLAGYFSKALVTKMPALLSIGFKKRLRIIT